MNQSRVNILLSNFYSQQTIPINYNNIDHSPLPLAFALPLALPISLPLLAFALSVSLLVAFFTSILASVKAKI